MSKLSAVLAPGVIPVVVIEDPGAAEALGHALTAGGLPSAEITLRTAGALEAIAALSALSGFTVGAGTVVDPSQAQEAVAAGASYLVSPGFSPAVSQACRSLDAPLIPGAVTATEIQAAIEHGHDVVKFFPAAAAGGVAMVRSLSAPFPNVRFVPTGGIAHDTLGDYLAVASVAAVGGTWIAPRDLIEQQDFEEITRRAAAAVALVKEAR